MVTIWQNGWRDNHKMDDKYRCSPTATKQ